MRRFLFLFAAALALGACFNFQKQIDGCKDDAGTWVCPRPKPPDGGADGGTGGGGGGGGSGGSGGGTGGGTLSTDDSGCPGATYHPDQTAATWCWLNPFPTGSHLYDVTGTAANDVWFVGEAMTLLHWDGAQLRQVQGPPMSASQRTLRSAALVPNGDLYVGGDGTNGVWRLRDGGWEKVIAGADRVHQLVARPAGGVLAASETGVWADGNPVRVLSLPVAAEGVAVFGPGPLDFFAAGQNPTAVGTRFVYSGDGGIAYSEPFTFGDTSFGFRRMWADDAGQVFAAASGTPNPDGGIRGSVVRRDALGNWTSPFLFDTDGTDLYAGTALGLGPGSFAVGQNRVAVWLQHPSGSLAAEVPGTSNTGLNGVWAEPGGAVWTVGDRGTISSGDPKTVIPSTWRSLSSGPLESFFGVALIDGGFFAVGGNNQLLRTPGTPPPPVLESQILRGVWVAPGGTAVVVGEGGLIATWRPGQSGWYEQLYSLDGGTGTDRVEFRDVWGSGDDDVLIAAREGLFAFPLDGGRASPLFAQDLWKVHGEVASGAAWAVGEQGVIWGRGSRGAGWALQRDGGANPGVLYAVTAESATSAWAGGEAGRVLHYSGGTWDEVLPSTGIQTVLDLAVTGTRLIAVGTGGDVRYGSTGTTPGWQSLRSPGDIQFERVRFTDGAYLVLGARGTVLKLLNPP